MQGYRLLYFYIRGKAQIIRYLLEDNALPYEEETVSSETWPQLKPTMMFGQLPCLYDGDLELVQSSAILRHLARKHGLYGASNTEAVLMDIIHDAQIDWRLTFVKLIYTQDNYEEENAIYLKNLPTHLGRFEKLLNNNNGGNGFFVGNKISYVDYSMFDLLSNHLKWNTDCLNCSPLLKSFVQRMRARENLSKYMASDKYKKMNITGHGRV